MSRRTADETNHGSGPTATNRRKGAKQSKKDNPFVKLELSDKQHAALKDKLQDDPSWPVAFMVVLVENGYRISLRWDDFTNSPAAWVFPPDDHETDAGLIMSGRGSSAFTALAEACYKIYVMSGQPWPRPAIEAPAGLWDG